MSGLESRWHSVPVVLVVEDDPLILLSTTEALRDFGWEVLAAPNAAEAITILDVVDSVAFVFSDVQMPGEMDGIGLAQWVREHRPAVRVMLTSGCIQPGEINRSLCVEGPIAKPYCYDWVSDRIAHHLGGCVGLVTPELRGA